MRSALLLMSITALAATACSTECPEGMVFGEDDTCRPDLPCDENGSCPSGYVCMPATSPDHAPACVPLDGSVPPSDASVDSGGGCGDCDDATPLCRTDDQKCVECLQDSHCEGVGGRCDLESGECVQCLGDGDCDDPAAARCDLTTSMCAPCTDNEHCEGNLAGGVCGDGACVQCTSENADACDGNPCTRDNTCSTFGTEQRACEPCDTDANCAPDHYCVPMQFAGEDRPGGYCLKSKARGCQRPFSTDTPPRTTLSGESGMVFCGIDEMFTTCEAVRALEDDVECGEPEDPPCPEGGHCRQIGSLTPNRCTYQCEAPVHCPDFSPANTCGSGYCGS